MPLQEVRPGDLITAADWNDLIQKVQDLEDRVDALTNTGGGPIIDQVLPSETRRIGEDLDLQGRNFGFSQGAHRVFFNGIRAINFRAGSSDTRLLFEIPTVPGVAEAGTPVEMLVTNASGTASRTITLQPRLVQQQGNISLTFQGSDPVSPTPGVLATFNYRLESQALLPTTVTLTPSLSVAAWQPNLRLVDATGQSLQNRPITLQPNEVILFSLRIDPIPAGTAGNTPFTVGVAAIANGVPGAQDLGRPFTVGTPAEQPDPTVTTLDYNGTSSPSGIVFGNRIIMATPGDATIQLRAEFNVASPQTYNVEVAIDPAAQGWSVQRGQFPPIFATPASYTVPSSMTVFPSIRITRTPSATTNARVVLRLINAGSGLRKIKEFELALS